MNELQLARARREDEAVNLAVDEYIKGRAPAMTEPNRIKVRGVLKHYAKSDTPFKDFVRDNLVKFGPGRTEAIGAVLCGEIKGKKAWASKTPLSDERPVVDADVLLGLDALSPDGLSTIMLEARAIEDHGSKSSVSLLGLSGADELSRVGAGLNLKEAS